MNSPLVSVIMPVYKWNIEWIRLAVKSVLQQSYKNIELIIINDFPTKEETDFFSQLKKENKKIVYCKNYKKTSIWHVRNQWISFSKWKYTAPIDCDDIWDDDDKIKKQVEFLENNLDYWMCGANTINYINESWETTDTWRKPSKYEDIRGKMLITNLFVHSSVLITKKCLDEIGWYIENSLAEDYNLWLRIWTRYKMANIDTSIKYRVTQQSLWHSTGFKTKRTSFKFVRKYKKYYPNKILALCTRILNIIIPVKISEKIAKLLRI